MIAEDLVVFEIQDLLFISNKKVLTLKIKITYYDYHIRIAVRCKLYVRVLCADSMNELTFCSGLWTKHMLGLLNRL